MIPSHQLNFLHFTPTLIWLNLYVVPLLLESRHLAPGTDAIHLFGSIFILLCFFVGDFLNARMADQALEPSNGNLAYVALALGLALSLLHLILVDFSFPLMIMEASNRQEAREAFTKGIPIVFRYFCNWSLSIFYPLAFGLFLRKRRYGWAVLSLLFGAGYAIASSALLPAVMLFWIAGTIFVENLNAGRSRYFLACQILFLLLNLCVILFYQSSLPETDRAKQKLIGMSGTATALRELGSDKKFIIHPKVDFFVYRIYFTPVEVSNNWYWYFSNEPRGFLSFLKKYEDENQSLSREIGLNIYRKNHPADFRINTINANAGIDADIFARFGVWGIICAGFIIIGLRIVSLCTRESELTWISSFIVLSILSILSFQGSIQAILVAHGLFILILIQTGLNPIALSRRFRAKVVPRSS